MRQASKHAHDTENVQQSAVGVTGAKFASVHEEEATNAPRGGEKEQRGNETRGGTVVGAHPVSSGSRGRARRGCPGPSFLTFPAHDQPLV